MWKLIKCSVIFQAVSSILWLQQLKCKDFLFLSVTVNWMSSCFGVLAGIATPLRTSPWTFFIVFWHFVVQTINWFIEKLLGRFTDDVTLSSSSLHHFRPPGPAGKSCFITLSDYDEHETHDGSPVRILANQMTAGAQLIWPDTTFSGPFSPVSVVQTSLSRLSDRLQFSDGQDWPVVSFIKLASPG